MKIPIRFDMDVTDQSAEYNMEIEQEYDDAIDDTVDTAPYLTRNATHESDIMFLDKVVGATYPWNQMLNITGGKKTNRGITASIDADGLISLSGTSTATYASVFDDVTVAIDHVYASTVDVIENPNNVRINVIIGGMSWVGTRNMRKSTVSGSKTAILSCPTETSLDGITLKANLFDLTKLFGATIADYINSLEESTAGAGISWFRNLFDKEYYPYDSGTLRSVMVGAHSMYNSDKSILHRYPHDGSLLLRGFFLLDNNNNLVYDGDEYYPSGKVLRKYGFVHLGDLNWYYNRQRNYFYAKIQNIKPNTNKTRMVEYTQKSDSTAIENMVNFEFAVNDNILCMHNEEYGNNSIAFKGSLQGVYMVYELEEPYTDVSAKPYSRYQLCVPNGTESFVDTRAVAIPVGHETVYKNPS